MLYVSPNYDSRKLKNSLKVGLCASPLPASVDHRVVRVVSDVT